MASSIIERLVCKEIPNIPIISIGNNPKTYLVHAHKVVSILINNSSRNAARVALDNLLKSDSGKHILQDGELTDAYRRGPISAMIYTYIFKTGFPSRFATLDGLKEIITHLPNQDEWAKAKYHALFNEYFTHLRAPLVFEVATQEQCLEDVEDEDAIQEIQTGGVRNMDGALMVTPRMYVDCLLDHAEKERKNFQEKLEMVQRNAILEKDNALLEMQLKNAALQKELDMERLRREYDAKLAAMKTPRSEASAKRAKRTETPPQDSSPVPPEVNCKQSVFAKLTCVAYSNCHPDVNRFIDLSEVDEVRDERLYSGHLPEHVLLVTRVADDAEGNVPLHVGRSDNKLHILAFAYRGIRVTRRQLQDARVIKEAYGVERNGLNFLCLVLDKSHGRRVPSIGHVPYELKLLPRTVVPERIEAQHFGDGWRHISALKTTLVTSDPVLTALKAPSERKWRWSA